MFTSKKLYLFPYLCWNKHYYSSDGAETLNNKSDKELEGLESRIYKIKVYFQSDKADIDIATPQWKKKKN